jgi:dihydroorotase
VHRAGILRKALQYQRLAGGVLCLHEEDPTLSGKGVMHEGDVSARLGLAGIPSVSESTLIARDAALARYEDGRIHIQHLSARESVEAVGRRQGGRRADQRRGVAAPPHGSPRRAAREPRHAAEDEPAAALRGRPPGADRRACATARSTASPPTTRRTRARRRRSPSRAPMGTTGLETAFAALHTELVLPGILPLAWWWRS